MRKQELKVIIQTWTKTHLKTSGLVSVSLKILGLKFGASRKKTLLHPELSVVQAAAAGGGVMMWKMGFGSVWGTWYQFSIIQTPTLTWILLLLIFPFMITAYSSFQGYF